MYIAVYAPDLNQDRLDAPQRCVRSILSVWNDIDDINYTVLTHKKQSGGVCSVDFETIPERRIKKEKAISGLNPDAVYTFRPRDILFPILIDAPVLLAYHGDVQIVEPQLNYGPYPRVFSFKQRVMEFPQFPQFDGMTCVSKDLAERARKRRFHPPVWVVHNGVDIDRFGPTATSELDLPDEYVLHLSAFSRRKNPTGVIRVFAEVESKVEAELVIAGSGWDSESRVQTLIQTLNLENRVEFLGYVSDEEVPGLYSDASAFLFPSCHEGFGLPVL
jgi:glycosyltransferase involved in cell wall biosynthesis